MAGLVDVVEAQQCRPQAPGRLRAQDRQPRDDVRDAERRQLPCRRDRHDLERDPGDHPERALRAEEGPAQVGAHRRARGGGQLRDRTVGQHDAVAHHQVLHPAVAGGELPGGERREPAAHRRAVQRLRGEARRPARLLERPLELAAVHTGGNGHGHVDLVDLVRPGQARDVEHDPAPGRERLPGHRRAKLNRRTNIN